MTELQQVPHPMPWLLRWETMHLGIWSLGLVVCRCLRLRTWTDVTCGWGLPAELRAPGPTAGAANASK